MKNLFEKDHGHKNFMIGMVHTLALPGAPKYDKAGGMKKVINQAREEAKYLEDAGFHGLLYCNESDMPYQTRMQPETVAAMTEVVSEVQAQSNLPHGINMLLDPIASLAIAHATGGSFVRAFLTGTYVGDLGFYTPDGAAILRMRENIGATDIRIICNVTAGFSIDLDNRSVEQKAKGAVFIGLADAVCVSGPAAGMEADFNLIKKVAQNVPETPIVVGTGVSADNIETLCRDAQAFIVGTSLKVDGKTLNPVDPQKAKEFMARANAVKKN
ncbi:BtpA/SgcQ family protein [Dethiosulfatarculus sandiegensis]|uniref:Sgc region protein SgcQ n=1 Tax=Dethiosulfatarculus sandiegensis TaxID=1429043 RepID=A0A0D2HQI5_9BACT|nr:BtpA/SgcQ family protein [Dethiosulfatarculus sandiegensis]KIX12743.1 sgc region protein SgcQ [Dethiosulfatarculus sandiegensis]